MCATGFASALSSELLGHWQSQWHPRLNTDRILTFLVWGTMPVQIVSPIGEQFQMLLGVKSISGESLRLTAKPRKTSDGNTHQPQ